MASRLVSFVLLLSLAVCLSISKHAHRNNSVILHDNFRANPNANFVLINPAQVHSLERTIRAFFSKVARPINRPIVLKSTSTNGNELQLTIREICDSVRKSFMQFVSDCGLIDTVRRYERDSSKVPLCDDWYSEMLLQIVYTIRDVGNVINEISSSIDLHLGEGNATSQENKRLARQSNSVEFLGVVHDAAEFSESLAHCLLQVLHQEKHRSPSNLNKAIFNLIKQPPKTMLKTLKSSMSNVSYNNKPKSYSTGKPWQIFLCLSLMNSDEIDYQDCIRELQHLEQCLHSSKRDLSGKTYNTDVKSWTKAIRRLSDCEITVDKRGETKVSCKTARRLPREIRRRTRYVFERMLDKRITKESPFRRAVDDLGDTLAKSELGRRCIDELCQYIGIYEDGRRKLRRFSRMQDKDRKAVARRKEISEALETYKKGVLLRTFGAMNKMHRSMVDFENFFAQGMKDTMKEAWQSHVKVLSCLMDWMTKLLELHSGESFSGKEPSLSDSSTSLVEWNDEDSNSENMQEFEEFAMARPRSEITKDVDKSMNNLIDSMNRMSRHRTVDKSMLACMANNVLLVTILMETIGFVSSLYCFANGANEQTSQEFDGEWDRKRRSLIPSEENQIIDLISRDYLSFRLYDNTTLPF